MLLIVSKTFIHPKMLSGSIRIANIVDTSSSPKNRGHPKILRFSKVPLASMMLSVTEAPFCDRGHSRAPQLPQASDGTNIGGDSLLRSKAISRTFSSAGTKRYRWYVPAGFFRYRSISLVTCKFANIRRYCKKTRFH